MDQLEDGEHIALTIELITQSYKVHTSEASVIHHKVKHSFSAFHGTILVEFTYSFLELSFHMAQSNLLMKENVEKSLAAVTKKRKIKVPHFDNSTLVQGYLKTLIGRCMNLRAHNINNMLFMLPRIWNVEERVVGTDFGLGRFQFDFDWEEDIVQVLKMEPFHFDH